MVAWLHLDQWLPYADVRRVLYSYLDAHDRRMIQLAHGVRRLNVQEMYDAIQHGYLEQVQYFYVRYMWVPAHLFEFALARKQEAIALWLANHLKCYEWCLKLCIEKDCSAVVRYGIEHLNWTWYRFAICDIVCEGNIELAEWAICHGCPWQEHCAYMSVMAVQFVGPERFQWVRRLSGGNIPTFCLEAARQKWGQNV